MVIKSQVYNDTFNAIYNVTLSTSENEGKKYSICVHMYEYLTSKVNAGKQVHYTYIVGV